ncbi:MAG: glycosyl transferase family 2, partial [Rhizobacter sp.]|nr:glycosyl transferase family 2 [Rhizobacter sp.]
NSMQRTVNSGKLRDLHGRLEAFDTVLSACGKEADPTAQWLATAHARLAAEALDEASRAFDRGRAADFPVDEYEAFALTAFPGAKVLPEWQELQRRRTAGASRYSPASLFSAVRRRAREEIGAARWWWEGV